MTARLPDWEDRLSAFLEEASAKEFKPGEHDGALFAANAVKAMTGEDLGAPFRGRYDTCKDGEKRLKQAGYTNLLDLLDGKLERIKKGMAQRGDVVMLKDKNLAVCFGHVALAVNPEPGAPFVRAEREDWQRAWKVG